KRKRECVLDDATDGHGTEPFAPVPLLKPSFGGEFGVGCLRRASHRIRETCPMADGNHQAQRTRIEGIDYFLCESFATGTIARRAATAFFGCFHRQNSQQVQRCVGFAAYGIGVSKPCRAAPSSPLPLSRCPRQPPPRLSGYTTYS